MGRTYILLVCIAVFSVAYTELDYGIVKRKSERKKYKADKYTDKSESAISHNKRFAESSKFHLESTKLTDDDEKYTDENFDFSIKGNEKQQDNSKNDHWGYDYDNSNKGDYDGGDGGIYEGRKDINDDNDYLIGLPKDTYNGHSYNAPAQKIPDVTCSYGVKFLAHPRECTKFYQCAHSKPFLFTCPSGLYFNTVLEVCDWPSNVDCTNDILYDSSYQARYEPSHELTHGNSHQSNYEPSHQDTYQHKFKTSSSSQPRMMTPSQPVPIQPPPVYSSTDPNQKPTINRDYGQDLTNYQKRHSFPYPLQSSFQPMVSPQFLPISTYHFPIIPVMQSPVYQSFIPFRSGYNQQIVRQSHYKPNQPSEDRIYKELTVDVSKERPEESTFRTKKTMTNEPRSKTDHSSTSQSVSTGDEAKIEGETIKKIFIRKNASSHQPDVSSKDKIDDTSSNRYYYYYYQDDSNDKDSKSLDQRLFKNNKKNPYNYYYLDSSNSDKNKNKKLSDIYDYDNKYYDYGKNYDYGYDYTNDHGHVQHMVTVDKNYNNKQDFKSNGKYVLKNNQMSDDELGYIHFDHRGRGTKMAKGKGNSLEDIGSLLPLLLLGGANGGQQLLLTTLLLSQLKPNGPAGKGLPVGKSKSGGNNKDDLFKKLLLLSLFTTRGNNVNIPTLNVANVRIVNGQFVMIATGQAAVVIDGITGLTVTPAQTSISPATGQLVVTATGNTVMLRDPTTGNLQPAILGNTLTIQGDPILPVTVTGGLTGRLNLVPTRSTDNRFFPLGPIINGQTTSSPSGRDAVNLIFLSPLTPSSLPPPIISNDGSATMIRGSLRDILGPNLSNFISNVPLVSGQGQPNSVAGNKQACSVLRSGETVPFRISPRGGRLLPSECDAIGKLLDKFVPTFLQNFVPSDAAFAGFGSNLGDNKLQTSPAVRSNINTDVVGSNTNIDISSRSNDNNLIGSGSINDFINVKNDQNGCTIAVPNIVPQC